MLKSSPLFAAAFSLLVACGGSANSGDDGTAASAAGSGGSGGAGGGSSNNGGSGGDSSATGGTGEGTGGAVSAGGMDAAGGANAGTSSAGGASSGGMDAGGSPSGGSAGACDVGDAPPNLPTLSGTFFINDATNMPPTETGGDPTGTWVFDKATVWLPAFAKGLVDTSKSTASGTAWARLDATDYSVQSVLALNLSTSLGAMMMNNMLNVTGTYTVMDATIVGTPTCGSMGTNTVITLQRDSATAGSFLVKTTIKTALGSGDVYVLLEGTVSP